MFACFCYNFINGITVKNVIIDEQYIKQLSQSRINKNDFSLIKIIGRGAFGEVQLVRNVHNKKVYAMKLLDKSELVY
jgi:serine/threonine protein kinase